MLLSVTNGGFQLGAEPRARRASRRPPQHQRRPDDRCGAITSTASAAAWRTGNRSRRPTCDRRGSSPSTASITGLPLADFLTRQAAVSSSRRRRTRSTCSSGTSASMRRTPGRCRRRRPSTTACGGSRASRSRSATARSTTSASIASTTTSRRRSTPTRRRDSCIPVMRASSTATRAWRTTWWQFSPRVGFAWDPAGDGRMSVRTGYSLAYDFVNAQFHLNTSVAPPFNAEARVDQPGRRLRRSVARDRQRERLPVHHVGPNSAFPLTGPVHLDPARHQAAAAAVVEPERPAADRQRPGRVGDLHRAATPTGCGTCARSIRASTSQAHAHCRQPTGPQFFPVCSVNGEPRSTPRADDGRTTPTASTWASVDEHTALGTRSTTACC